MDDAPSGKYLKALDFYRGLPARGPNHLMAAICLTQLADFPKARGQYRAALADFLADRDSWHSQCQPSWLVDAYIMAAQPELLCRVAAELAAYKLDRRSGASVALYSFALMELLAGHDREAANLGLDLLKWPKPRDCQAMGKVIDALVERNQRAFDKALDDLLRAHRDQARHYGDGWSPEWFLSLPAMSLSWLALGRGLSVPTGNEYLSNGYLTYLQMIASW